MTAAKLRARATVTSVACWLVSMTLVALAQEGRTPLLRDIDIGIRQVQRRAFDAARVTLEGVVRRLRDPKTGPDPDLARAQLYLGVAYWSLGHEDVASAQFREALDNDAHVKPLEEKDLDAGARALLDKARGGGATPAEAARSDSRTPVSAVASARPDSAATGMLQIGVKPWAAVAIDGRDYGSSPIAPVPLSVGVHTVRLTHPDYQPVQRKIAVSSTKTVKIFVDLELIGILVAASSSNAVGFDSTRFASLVADLANPDRKKRSNASETLVSAGDDAVEELSKALRSPDAQTRGRAAWALGRINTEKARALVPAVKQLLTDSDPFVRKAAEESLGRMTSPSR